MKELKSLLIYLRKYKRNAFLNILFNILVIVFSLFSVIMIIPFLQLLFGKIPPVLSEPSFSFNSTYLIEFFKYKLSMLIHQKGQQASLAIICIFVSLIFLLKNLFRYLAVLSLAPVRNGVIKDIRNELFQKVVSLPLSYFSNEKKGEIITRITEDVKEIEWSVMSFIEVTVREPLTIILNLAFMIFLSPQLTVFVFAMLLVTGLIIGRIGKSLKRESGEAQHKASGMVSIVDETLNGIRIIKAFSAEKFKTNQFSSYNNEMFEINNRALSRRELSSPLTEFLAICVVCLVLWFGGNLVLHKKMLEAETFIGFMVLFSQLIPPAKSFSNAFYNIQRGFASTARINEIINEPNSIIDNVNASHIKEFQTNIEYRNVSFVYSNSAEREVVKDFNFTIEKGKLIALVGPSGAGKSTLVDLLPRFYDPSSGEILIDGISLKEYSIHSLRNLFGMVSQEAILFNDTIFNNVAFGLEGVSEESVIEACKIANAHNFIIKLEQGYQTNIGDKGGKLSGGERQRLTIARAILRNPSILILDEATSSLDSESEKLVQDALNKLMKGRTTVVIAHRLSTVQHADEIVVLQHGKIAERGTHIDLMEKGGLYSKLVELQTI